MGLPQRTPAPEQTYLRKIRKPLIEKKRRDRINTSIERLKCLLTTSTDNISSISKLDKAEILELAVDQVKKLSEESRYATTTTPDYFAGFNDCTHEAVIFLSRHRTTDRDSTHRLNRKLHDVLLSKKVPGKSGQVSMTTAPWQQNTSNISPMPFSSTPHRGQNRQHSIFSAMDTSLIKETDFGYYSYMNNSASSGIDTSLLSDSLTSHHGNKRSYAFSVEDTFVLNDSGIGYQGYQSQSAFSVTDIDISTDSGIKNNVSSNVSGHTANVDSTDEIYSMCGYDNTNNEIVSANIIQEEKPWRPW